jgi:transcription factor SOX1/3/14/21 (SOX group B)
MSAFLYFSQDKRKIIKAANPDMANTEISRVLGEMWKNTSLEERKVHIDREAEERKKYKIEIASWRQDDAVRKEKVRRDQVEKSKIAKTVASLANPYRGPPASLVVPQQAAYYHPAPSQVSTPPHMAYAQHRPAFFQEAQYAEQQPTYYPPPPQYGYSYNPHAAHYGGYAYPQYDYSSYAAAMPHASPASSAPPMMSAPSDGYHDPDNVRSSAAFPGDHMNRDPQSQPARYPAHPQAPPMQHYMPDPSGSGRPYPGYDYGAERR